MKQLRLGILSTAGIARRNWRAIHESGNTVVTAVASRDKARARQFVRECQDELPFDIFPAALGSYEELLASSEVDAIYNPLPTGLRKEWVLRAAAAGKHVICEKPCGLNLAGVREMTDACAKSNVQFMDGVMFMHHPRMEKIRAALDDADAVGQIKRLTSMHTFSTAEKFFANNIRVHSALEPTGCLGDLGWYCIRFALWAMKWQTPASVTAKIISARGNANSPAAAPTEFSAELIFPGGASASFYCSFLVAKQQWFQVSGSKGYLRLDDFVHPKKVYEPSFELNGAEMQLEKIPFAQDANLFRNFAVQVATGQLNHEWSQWAVQTQAVMDECYAAALTAAAR
ncbi:MAG: Glucose--fructose oxidoreductase precursor [Verrucomicrobiota bacterium]